MELDRDILRLIARRARMLRELPKGREATRIERELRAGWEASAGKVSRDPRLIRQLFALLQEVECLPRPSEGEGGNQDAFMLTPARRPVDVTLTVPADCRRTRILGAMAAASGTPCELTGILVNDPLVSLVKGFNQLGPSLRWEEDGRLLCVPERGAALGGDKALLDRAVHIGEDMLNFLLLLFSMAVRPCRLKIMGESALKLADFSPLRHFLPAIGARFTSIVPGQEGLPARLEASGILPESVDVPATLAPDAVLALCLGLACAPRPHDITVRLGDHPKAQHILGELMEIFDFVQFTAVRDNATLHFPAAAKPLLQLPDNPELPMDMVMAVTVLCLPALIGGTARVKGNWPTNPAGRAAWTMLESAGLRLVHDNNQITAEPLPDGARSPDGSNAPDCAALDDDLLPLVGVLAAKAAAAKGAVPLPACMERADMTVVDEFFDRLGLERTGMELHRLSGTPAAPAPWSSPSSPWTAALALGAFVRPGLKLFNPGIVTEHMPGFWQWYNGLPSPTIVRPPVTSAPEAAARPTRRRILAGYMPEDQMPEPLPMDDD